METLNALAHGLQLGGALCLAIAVGTIFRTLRGSW